MGKKQQDRIPRVNPADLADEFLAKCGFATPEGLRLRRYRGDWLQFDGMVFRPWSDEEMKAAVTTFLRTTEARPAASTHFLNSTIVHLQSLCLVPNAVEWPARLSGEEWVTQQHCVVMQNGILNLSALRQGTSTTVLSPHTPALLCRVSLPYSYDPQATCPRWLTFLETVLPDPESRQLLQEIFGYCLTFDISMQRFFLFEGSGANGKGVTLNILRHLVGKENVSALPLSRFNSAHELIVTLAKMVNITNELGERFAEEPLKQFVGGDLMHLNPKHKEPFSAKPTAKLVNATNVLPHVTDRSDGFWRRVMILPFPVTIPEDERDPTLEDKLALELSGILNWSIAGAHVLYQRGRFIEPQVSVAARQAWRNASDPIGQFLETWYEAREDGQICKQEMYSFYTSYCQKRGETPLSAQRFHHDVKRQFPGATQTRPRSKDGSRPHMYQGIAVRSIQEASVEG